MNDLSSTKKNTKDITTFSIHCYIPRAIYAMQVLHVKTHVRMLQSVSTIAFLSDCLLLQTAA